MFGILLGAIIHYLAKFLIRVLGIDKASEERGRTLASYRAERTERQAKKAQQDKATKEAASKSLLGMQQDPAFARWAHDAGFRRGAGWP